VDPNEPFRIPTRRGEFSAPLREICSSDVVYGFGKIRLSEYHDAFDDPDPKSAIARATLMEKRPLPHGGWNERELERPSLLAFLALFGLVIGPINLFVFGRRKDRLRLVWTTPVIAIVATLLLTVLILSTDGIGGVGDRWMVTLISSRESRKLVLQDQASRTGVVWQRQSEGQSGLYMDQYGATSSHGRQYLRIHDTYDGDWFSNRGDQAQSLEWFENTRERIEIDRRSIRGPSVLSSVAQPLGTFFYVDPDDAVWTAEKVAPGTKIKLKRSDRKALHAWLQEQVGGAGLSRMRALGAERSRDWFFASGENGAQVAVQTYTRISWHDAAPLFLGPVEQVGR
jgi:hypothetical protein